jgi:SAM-dependent methyltransferase
MRLDPHASVVEFYDALAPWYHLVYPDWEASIAWQGEALAALLAAEWGDGVRRLRDVTMGVGTQALGLAARGYQVIGSDLSPSSVRRAGAEATRRGLTLRGHVADVRALAARPGSADAVLACDNALPHLLSEDEIQVALAECLRCLRPGGGCVVSLRDYGPAPAPGTEEIKDYGHRVWEGRACRLRQIWRWRGPIYDVAFELVATGDAAEVILRTPPTTYFAVPVARVAALMGAVGFSRIRRVDDCLFQPVLVGTR